MIFHGFQILEIDDFLRNPAAGFGTNEILQLFQAVVFQVAPEHHAVAAGLAHVLDDQPFRVGEHVISVFLVIGEIGGRILQYGLFAEIVFHHAGHEVVKPLVVGHAVAGTVQHGHVARGVGLHEVRHAEEGESGSKAMGSRYSSDTRR